MRQRRFINFSGPVQTLGAIAVVAVVSLTFWQVKAALLNDPGALSTTTATISGLTVTPEVTVAPVPKSCNLNRVCEPTLNEAAEYCTDCATAPSAVCGNGTCEGNLGETNASCASDCPLARTLCGDSVCQATESNALCPSDCPIVPGAVTATNPVCGNTVCETALGESNRSCPNDCPVPTMTVPAVCGDGTCQATESVTTCPNDCSERAVCGDAVCSFDKNETATSCPSDCSSGTSVAYICGDSRCDSPKGENMTNCPGDCRCGNRVCEATLGETSDSCLTDCPRAVSTFACNGNGICDQANGETAALCPAECVTAAAVCGNSLCEATLGETSTTCSRDCVVAATASVCGDLRCDSGAGETSATCLKDCPTMTRATACGNTICETGETSASCPSDCKATTVTPNGYICGDQLCQRDRGESDLNCERDCPRTATVPTATCADSDGGRMPKIKGTVRFGSAVYTDACVDERQVREAVCENNRYAAVVMSCEAGTTCQLGACLPPVKTTTTTPTAPVAPATLTTPALAPTPVRPPASTTGATVTAPRVPTAPVAPVAPTAPTAPVAPTMPRSPQTASAPVTPETDRVPTPSGELITLPDECVKAGITTLEACRTRLAALKAIPTAQPATLAAVPTARCGDGRCESSERATCDADCRPPVVTGLPLVCTSQGLLNATSCQDFLSKIAKEQRTVTVTPPPTVTLTRDRDGKALSERCFSLGYSSEAGCAAMSVATPVATLPATVDTVRSELPEACVARGVTSQTDCAELLKSISLPDACVKAGLREMTACQAYLAAQRRPASCAVSGQLTDASCLPVAEKAYVPPLCQQLGQTDADQCRDAVFAKYGLPAACAGMSKDACWRLVQTGRLNDRDFTAVASKDLVTESCLADGAVTLGACGKKAAEATLPEDCLLAGRFTPSDCDRFLFEKGRQTVASDTLSGVCTAAKITDPTACATYLTASRLPTECVKANLKDAEACHKFIAALDLPTVCREAGVTSRDECEAMLRKRAEVKSCAGLLTGAKLDDATRNEVCNEVIYRETAAKVVCEGLTPDECEANAKTRHLGSIAEASERLDSLKPLEDDAKRGTVRLDQWKRDHATTELPQPTLVNSDQKLTVLASRSAIVVKESGAVETAPRVVTVVDTDNDGLPDDVEQRLGTDAAKASTDGQTPDREAVRQRVRLAGIDRALADGQPLGQPLAEGVADDRLQVTTVTSADKPADGTTAPIMLSGSGVPGEVITVYLYSDMPLVATTTVDENGQWQLSIDDQLGEGVHEAYIAINDDTGRVTRKSEPLAFIIQAAQAVTPAAAAQAAAATAPDINVAATSAPSKDLGLFIIGGIMLLLAAGLTIAIIAFTRKR